MKKKIMTATILITAIVLICILSQACYANGIDFSGLQNIYNNSGDEAYQSIGGKIIGTVQFICYGAAVIIIILKGVKLMNAAPEAKADAKKEMISYTIGAVLLFAVGTILKLVADIATKAF